MTPEYFRRIRNKILIGLLAAGLMLISPAGFAADEIETFAQQWQQEDTWLGDFDGMKKRRLIRVLVAHNRMLFFFDEARTRGLTHDAFREFETFVNKKLNIGSFKVKVVFLPVPRDRLLPWLAAGKGDIAAANLTITESRQALVDFTSPIYKNVSEILVTGPSATGMDSLGSLSGKEVHVRHSSSYYEHLQNLNETFVKQGKAPVMIATENEFLEDSDLLEMVNAGLLPMVVVDDHKARFWAQIFPDITLHQQIVINQGGNIAWAIRKDSPQLKGILNEFVKANKKGSLLGNILFKQYLVTNKWARNALSTEDLQRFNALSALFRQYADQYQFDYLMMAALAYQESQLDHNSRSHVGAVGIMQVLPSTAKDKNVGIPDIDDLENNIHAGIKYLRFLHDRYFNDPAIDPLNQMLFSFAAYNAGPAKVRRLRKEAESMGLDPNIWFTNVEVVAAKRIGRETVQYVGNIYKYYLAYRLVRTKNQVKQKQDG